MEILSKKEKMLVEDFRTGKISLAADNAKKIRDLINVLTQGIDKVEISLEDFGKQLDRPLTPQEAIDTLTGFIDSLCVGKERAKVRIIVK